jgi:hypothetical protein
LVEMLQKDLVFKNTHFHFFVLCAFLHASPDLDLSHENK